MLKKIKFNVIFSLLFKGLTIAISLVLVPIAVDYLGKEKYGIWITISALANWLIYFDFGAGNGLRHRLTEELSKKNKQKARQLISSTYFVVFFSFLLVFIVVLIISNFIDWSEFLNAPSSIIENIDFLVVVVISLFFFRFVLQLIQNVFYALHYPSLNDLILFIAQSLVLVLFLIISQNNDSSLFKASIIYVGSPLIILFIASIVFYRIKTELQPSISTIDFNLAKEVLNLGGGFMLLQASAVFLNTTTPILISHFLNPGLTAEYNISLKYFGIVTIIVTKIMQPFWSSVTEAFVKKDFKWIKKYFYKTQIIAFGFSIIVILLVYIAPIVFRFWIPNLSISKEVIVLSSCFVITFTITRPVILFINGTGRIKEQMYFSLLIIVTIIPLDLLLFYYYDLGLASFIIPPIVFRILRSVRGYFQLKRLVLK